MLKGGVHLTLMIGPAVPVPVPRDVIAALTSVEVTSAAGQRSGFQLNFQFSAQSPLSTLLTLVGEVGPVVRVVLIVTLKGVPHVLSDGVITDVQVTPDTQSGQTMLTLTGTDLSAVLEVLDLSGLPFPAMSAEARVALILAKYAALGIVPLVIPTLLMDVPIPVEQIPAQQGNDLQYIQQLADQVGYVFYIEPGPAPLTSVAYWGPEIKLGIPQPALTINMATYTNVESLNFRLDNTRRFQPVLLIYNELTKMAIPVPIPSIDLLNPPLGLLPPAVARIGPVRDTANRNITQATLRGIAEAARSTEAITATGSLDVLRYGHVLKSRGLVGVRGAGHAFDGLYYVQSVTHKIERGDYKINFSLSRNGLISTLPVVPI